MVTEKMIEAAKAEYAECLFLTDEQVHSSITRIVKAALSTDAEPVSSDDDPRIGNFDIEEASIDDGAEIAERLALSPQGQEVATYTQIADALEACDWAGCSIGNKDILRATVQALRHAAPPAPSVAVKALDLDAVYVIPREMTDEEWSEVKYNVDRKANPDIELWRIKEAVKYANFIAGHRGRSALSAQVQDVAIPDGWQLVPKEPTDEMHNAARDWAIEKYGMGVGRDGSDGCYRAMLAAAPAAKLEEKP